ncbi:alkane 1-monooxygenase [Roseobacter sinensis]|uniref:Alkane 1-monooxygenase n=1 Tax=Roseobacter sinensis TaxID=2931391 RepID=A0ABT3BB95_9RHOB|nr:alkane 1-monooxygenase [Roseobacter sp. WL0113]MCV3270383.1 alkane 1-monooxygenase [Roseobacter sp. WL0113]
MTERVSSLLFASASLGPAVLLLLGATLGGSWPVIGLLSITAGIAVLDRTGIELAAGAGQDSWLPVTVGTLHFALLGAGVWAVGAGTHLGIAQKLALALGIGLYLGQVSNACAHELIHRGNRRLRALGTAIYCSMLNGHHVSAHLLVHHVHAGTAKDPNSAPLGQGFWRFFGQVIVGEFVAGFQAEARRLQNRPIWHPYALYVAGGLVTVGAGYALGGLMGFALVLVFALHAHLQLMLSDYLQHYGLRRRIDADGRPEPMGPQHSWNAPRGFSAALMLNAPLHSDHHMNPARRFSNLRHDAAQMPTLPRSVPVMGALALVPPLWRKVMDPKVRTHMRHTPSNHGTFMPKPEPQTGSRPTLLSE